MSTISNSELRSALNELIQTCKDGQEGFLTAAENVAEPNVQEMFNEYSLQRAKFVGELQAASHDLGDGNPESASSITGALHRGWINLKTALAGRDTHAILSECERGEDSAVATFHKALLLQIPGPLRQTIQSQLEAIQAAHERVKTLRDGPSLFRKGT